MNPKYVIEAEYDIEPGCRCCSCWERTGRWSVFDQNSDWEGKTFESRKEAEEWVEDQGVEEVEIDGNDYTLLRTSSSIIWAKKS